MENWIVAPPLRTMSNGIEHSDIKYKRISHTRTLELVLVKESIYLDSSSIQTCDKGKYFVSMERSNLPYTL